MLTYQPKSPMQRCFSQSSKLLLSAVSARSRLIPSTSFQTRTLSILPFGSSLALSAHIAHRQIQPTLNPSLSSVGAQSSHNHLQLRNASGKAQRRSKDPNLEDRIAAIPLSRFRNFCIVAHVDHGKSTLSDRLLELTGTVDAGADNKQVLDKLDVERERGITVKAQTCSMIYNNPADGLDYLLHLVDTPGHVDFREEVSRSYASCNGALLLVDASQGVQAQTVANFYLAFSQGLALIPVINKIDLPTADPDRALCQMQENFEIDPATGIHVSAKTGVNIEAILPAVLERIPAPQGDDKAPLRLLLVDSWYDNYRGVILLVRMFDGVIRPGDHVRSLATGNKYIVGEVGIMYPDMTPQSSLRAGQVGYIFFNPGMKRSQDAKVGDTYTTTDKSGDSVELLPGFADPKPMVFVSAYPSSPDGYGHLDDSINRLSLNDRSISIRKESSVALGAGWRLGFLGMLHCSVFEDRLRQEHGASIILTPPTVPFKVVYKDGTSEIFQSPHEFPDTWNIADSTASSNPIAEIQEPYVNATLTLPEAYLGRAMELCEANRGTQTELTFFTPTQLILRYSLPLSRLVDDFFGKLKSATQGYASLDYDDAGFRPSRLCRLQLLVNREPVDAISRVVHSSEAVALGRKWVRGFKQHVQRQMFEVIIQARVSYASSGGGTGRASGGGSTEISGGGGGGGYSSHAGYQPAPAGIVARETLKAFRKDVLAKLHASDISRRKKLLEKQKDGKKRMRASGVVNVDQTAFQKFLAKGGGGD